MFGSKMRFSKIYCYQCVPVLKASGINCVSIQKIPCVSSKVANGNSVSRTAVPDACWYAPEPHFGVVVFNPNADPIGRKSLGRNENQI